MTTWSRPGQIVLLALFAIGLAARLVYLDVPPIDFHPTRQYRGAAIARAESGTALAGFSAAERIAAEATGRAQRQIEPEVLETIAIGAYAVMGKEDLRAPRFFSILAWLGGALALFWLLRLAHVPPEWSLAGVGFTLLAPYSIDASRAFMPDPLMVGLMMVALALTLRHHVAPSSAWTVARLVAIGAALYVKPMALCFIGPAVFALDVARLGLWRGLVSTGLTCGAAGLLTFVHYTSLISEGNTVAQSRFFPELWLRSSYWLGWFDMIRRVIGLPALVLSLIGLVLGRGPLRLLLVSAWSGYVVMGLLLTHHISTHDYYSLPILPLTGASLALVLHAWPRRSRIASTASLAAIVLVFVPQWNVEGVYGDVERARQTAADYEHIGTLTGHSPSVISLDGAYGKPLAYHGRIVTTQLPLSIDRAISDLTGQPNNKFTAATLSGGAYFAGTLQAELDAQPDLRTLLEQRHVLVDRGGTRESWRYVLYDLEGLVVVGTPNRLSVFTQAGAGPENATVQILAPEGIAWRAVASDATRIDLEPNQGVGDTTVQVISTPGTPGTDGTVTIDLFAANQTTASGQVTVLWRTQAEGPDAAPIGFVDSPEDPVTVGDAPIVFQGWALDDLKLTRVDVFVRDASGTETLLGEATRDGRRPDVAAAFPTSHDLERAAWHFVLTRTVLADAGIEITPTRSGTIVFRAVDGAGTSAAIGERTVRRE